MKPQHLAFPVIIKPTASACGRPTLPFLTALFSSLACLSAGFAVGTSIPREPKPTFTKAFEKKMNEQGYVHLAEGFYDLIIEKNGEWTIRRIHPFMEEEHK